MRETYVHARVHEPTGARGFFSTNQRVAEVPSDETTVKVGLISLENRTFVNEFGIKALLHDEDQVVVLIENPDRPLFIRQEGEDESIAVKRGENKVILIGPRGLRIIDRKTHRQLVLRVSESLTIGADIESPEPELSASVVLSIPK